MCTGTRPVDPYIIPLDDDELSAYQSMRIENTDEVPAE